jgi:hypothetical protein
MSRFQCANCKATDGRPIYRTSPKGEAFEGLCERCMGREGHTPDPVTRKVSEAARVAVSRDGGGG